MINVAEDADTIVLGGELGDERGVFDFESDFAADLRCIPMVVRFKLDRVGIKLSLRQWSKIGATNRQALLARRCDTRHEAEAYRQELVGLVMAASKEAIVSLPADPAPAWSELSEVPTAVTQQALKSETAPPTLQEWSRLSTIQRFALLKLSRSNHDNDNFLPALREFGLR